MTSEYDDIDELADDKEGNREGVATEASTAPEPELQPVESGCHEKTVLVLEDDPAQILLLRRHLESLQMKVAVARTIAAARELLNKNPPHLAIFDVRLPDGSGLDLCEEIDLNPQLAGMPVIVLSSMDSEDMVRKTRASGGRFFLGKPYDPNVLLLVIEQVLREER